MLQFFPVLIHESYLLKIIQYSYRTENASEKQVKKKVISWCKTESNKLIYSDCCGNSSEPAAHTAALVALAALAAPAAQGEVALALLSNVIRHLYIRKEAWAKHSSSAFYPLLVQRDHHGTLWGKHSSLNFNLLVVIGLIHSVNWTYHQWFHWHLLMCRNWSVIAPCLLQLLHLLMILHI